MYSLGIDIGYASVKVILIDGNDVVLCQTYILHKGNVRNTLRKAIKKLLTNYDADEIVFGAATGIGSTYLAKKVGITCANEVAATVEGCLSIRENAGSIIEIGGQSAKYITGFNKRDRSGIKISMNTVCSAGTGSFLEEQVSRLNLNLEDYALYAARGTSVPRIAGRCSVFAKTDITHHQQEGIPVEDILLGLAHAMVRNYRGAVMGKLPRKKPVLFVGGVAQNQAVTNAIKEELKLGEEELIVPECSCTMGALGAAVIAKRDKTEMDVERLVDFLDKSDEHFFEHENKSRLQQLFSFGADDSRGKHECRPADHGLGGMECWLGIDVGSTSTNLVLSDRDNRIVWYKYLRTMGDPIEAVRKGLREMKSELGDKINVSGVGTTGSGRHLIGRLVGADVIRDEITSQAKAAVTIDADVDTIFEIGGQDSKYISLERGVVTDFQMNKICAAGTGSFIEEQAKKFGIAIHDFGGIALAGKNPIHLGERCTVFMGTSIATHLAKGAAIEDIASGLCYAVVKNYLNRVVGQKKIGQKIFFQGGVAFNQGVVNAFRSLTGKEVSVPPFFSVTGAYGVSILAREEIRSGRTGFRGFDIEEHELSHTSQDSLTTAENNAELFNAQIEGMIFHGYEGSIDKRKKTVGIPRALFTYGMFPMFYTFFKELGFNVQLSAPTSDETIRLGQEYSLAETCYPIKLINGHVAELVQKKVDYIFFPDLYTVDHPGSQSRQNYGCAYMQLAFKVISQAMELKAKEIELLAPTIAFSLGKEFMMKSFSDLGKHLGRSAEETIAALGKSMEAFHAFENRIKEHGKDALSRIVPTEKAFVLVSKIYGVADPVLNMGIPGKLMDMGYKVLGFYDLPEEDISGEHPNMYWPFGQHILEPAHFIREHPNLYAILLTHHGCGPDSVLTHYFREIMDGKPYLNIEVDEHSSDVGVITRIEAFVNSLDRERVKNSAEPEGYSKRIVHKQVSIKTGMAEMNDGAALYLPYMYPYSHIFAKMLVGRGINAEVLPETNAISIDLGRKHIMTNEYFSLTALLGDVLRELDSGRGQKNGITFLIPQTEGAEIDGQANRFIRTKLDEEGYRDVDILAPFIEDALSRSREDVRLIFMGLLAGDLVRFLPSRYRQRYCKKILDTIGSKPLETDDLVDIAQGIPQESGIGDSFRRVLALGEPFILFNDFLNDFSLRNIEEKGHRVIYAPLSEYLWVMWRDFIDQNKKTRLLERLGEFKEAMRILSHCLLDDSPFESDPEDLITRADKSLGYYAGAFGRYRQAKILSDLPGIDGIITLASTYENTEISLNIVRQEFENSHSKPVLNLTFDGNRDENDKMKIESFLYYLQ